MCYGVGAVVLIIGLLAAVGKIGGSGRPIALDEEETQSAAVAAAADGNWGLSFQQEGEPPVANATSEYLDQFHTYYIDDSKAAREEKYIYLTFDAGYENGYTEKILDVLQEEEVPAAFFLVGNYIEENPELVKRMEKKAMWSAIIRCTIRTWRISARKRSFKKSWKSWKRLIRK